MMPETNHELAALAVAALLVAALLGGCARGARQAASTTTTAGAAEAATAGTAPVAPPPVSDQDLSYRHQPLTAPAATPGARYTEAGPGESETLERSFENAPPLIPHAVDDLLPITISNNACLDCHLPANAGDVGATAMPASHFFDMRRRTQVSEVNRANYVCTLCHAPQTDAEQLITNTFAPEFRDAQRSRS